MSNEETKRKLLQKDSFRLAKGLVLLSKRTPFGIKRTRFETQKDYICSTPTNPCIICTQIFAKTEFFD